MENNCVNCGGVATIQHHVVPKSLGGVGTVPLCDRCHNILHEKENKKGLTISELTKEALTARYQRTGLKNGNKKGCDMSKAQGIAANLKRNNARTNKKNVVAANIIKLELAKGQSLQKIADYLNQIGLKTVTGKAYTKSQVQALVKMFDLKKS